MQIGVQFPVLFRHERFDFPLALNDQTHRHRLYATGRKAARNFFPQQRRNHITHDAVHKATRLLGVDAVDIQFARRFKRLTNRIFGDFVEHDAAEALVVAADDFPQVPGDGFPFAVKVGCEINVVSVLRQRFQFGDDFFLAGQDLIIRFPAVIGIDAHAADQRGLFIFFNFFRFFVAGPVSTLFRG